jgi:hypothetical protein
MATSKLAESGGVGTVAKDARKSAFDAIQQKAKRLSAKLGEADFDRDGNPIGPWAEMLAELDAWAKKYGVQFRTTEHVSGGGKGQGAGGATPRSHNACPGKMTTTERTDWVEGGHITIETTWTLRRQTIITGRCVYSCVGTIVDLQIE